MDLERLVKLAYTKAEAVFQDTLARDQFVDVLPDKELPLGVWQGRCELIQELLSQHGSFNLISWLTVGVRCLPEVWLAKFVWIFR